MRQMATVKEVTEVRPIEGKDRIDQYMIGGWSVIDQKSKYKAGDVVVYLEPDSWVPKEIAPFLCRSEKPKEYCGVVGEKLRTIKMAGVYSQGLILSMSVLPEAEYSIGQDVSEILGIVKWEPPQTFYQGQQKGNFPFFIPKTDLTRVQNLKPEEMQGSFFVTEKLEGSSMTVYYKDGVVGVCSRNCDLKLDDLESNFVSTAIKYDLLEKLKTLGKNIAIQGELIGPGVQGNHYGLSELEYHVFDVFDIDKQEYMPQYQVSSTAAMLGLNRVPVISADHKHDGVTVDAILEFADDYSRINSKVLREGVVFVDNNQKRHTFKAVSNKYLAKQG